MQYGSHSSCDATIEQTKKSILKDRKRSHSIPLDERMRWYFLHFQQCPMVIVDLNHPIKATVIYDALHHIFP